MRVLLDENLDHRLRRSFDRSVEVRTVAEQGWKGKRNGELLALASREFDSCITGDQNLEYQQNVARYNLGIIVLVAQSNRLADMQPLIPRVCEMLPTLRPGTVVRVAATTPPEVPETHNRGASGRS
jgi:predicted nuclease of predicted toxin-antitoxin system